VRESREKKGGVRKRSQEEMEGLGGKDLLSLKSG